MAEAGSRTRTVFALSPYLLGAAGVSLLGLFATRRIVAIEHVRPANDVIGSYLQSVGTVYAVLLAFVVYVVWQQFNEARAHLAAEANEVIDLYRIAKGFPASEQLPLQDCLRRYVEAVLHREWHAMANCNDQGIEVGAKILDELWDHLRRFVPGDNCHSAMYGEALSRFNDLSDLRTERLTSARTRIPFAMRLLLYFGAVVVVGSMWLFAVDTLWVHGLITALMAGAISHVLFLIEDLDRCFAGDFQIAKRPFERVLDYMAVEASAGAPAA